MVQIHTTRAKRERYWALSEEVQSWNSKALEVSEKLQEELKLLETQEFMIQKRHLENGMLYCFSEMFNLLNSFIRSFG